MQSTLYKSKYLYFQNGDAIWLRTYFKDQENRKFPYQAVTSSREIIFKNQTFTLHICLSFENALNLKWIKRVVSSEIATKYLKIRSLSFWIVLLNNFFIVKKELINKYIFLKRRPVMWSPWYFPPSPLTSSYQSKSGSRIIAF